MIVRIRPPFYNPALDELVENGDVAEEPTKPSTVAVDDQVVKLVPVRVDRLRWGLSRMLDTYGNSNGKIEKVFKFDRVFGETSTQHEVFSCVEHLVPAVIEGFTSTVISYGPTFGGKSYTMVGTEQEPGVIPRAVELIFKLLEEKKAHAGVDVMHSEVEVSYVELHNNIFRNLLKIEPPPVTPLAVSTKTPVFTIPETPEGDDSNANAPVLGRDPDRIDILESPTFGVFLYGGGLRFPVRSAEDAFNVLRRGEGQRLSRSTTSPDGSTRYISLSQIFIFALTLFLCVE